MGSNGVWCAKCAKYLAFGTYGTTDTDALTQCVNFLFLLFFFFEKEHCNFIDEQPNQLELQKQGVEEHPPSTL